MDAVVGKPDLEPDELPDITCLCARYQELKPAVFRSLLRHSADIAKPDAVHEIDPTGFDRQGTSHHYSNRSNYRFKAFDSPSPVRDVA